MTLIAVVKTVAAERVRQAVEAGIGDLGESRVQEAEIKIGQVGRDAARWHMVGHLQGNKAARAAALFDRVHGVDGAELAERLSRHADAAGRRLPVLVQVNAAREAGKHGVDPDGAEALLERVASLPGLALDGLMTIGPAGAAGEAARPWFRAVRELRDRAARAVGVDLPQLSMGMSDDYEVAVEEGSTMVRIGTALFGRRG